MYAATSQISYTASKGGVLSLSRELGVQFARQGGRVNALCPGPVNTPLLEELFASDPLTSDPGLAGPVKPVLAGLDLRTREHPPPFHPYSICSLWARVGDCLHTQRVRWHLWPDLGRRG